MQLLTIAALLPPHPLAVVEPYVPTTVAVTLAWDATNLFAVTGFNFSWRTNDGPINTITLTNHSPTMLSGTFQFQSTNLPPNVPIMFAVNCIGTNGLISEPATLTWNQQWYCVVDIMKGDGKTWTNGGTIHSNLAAGPELFVKLNVRKITK